MNYIIPGYLLMLWDDQSKKWVWHGAVTPNHTWEEVQEMIDKAVDRAIILLIGHLSLVYSWHDFLYF